MEEAGATGVEDRFESIMLGEQLTRTGHRGAIRLEANNRILGDVKQI